MRKFGRLAVVFAALAALFGLNQGSAFALESYCTYNDGDDGGKSCWIYHENSSGGRVDMVYFEAYGEKLHISDYEANGEGVVAYVNGTPYYWTKGNQTGYVWNLSFAEGASITLKSCQTDGAAEYDCHTEYAVA
ncbi:hypothetical protein ACFTUC_13605 [Streptomyces sp. NPDC056944]|uniref:hypothetical protein n=1 Tax=Streptomyces sp. NPDC056944 TaxID=3345972 RepID=UPI0036271E81